MWLVDANVLLDLLTADPIWGEWSGQAIWQAQVDGLAINPVIYAEVAFGFSTEEGLRSGLSLWPLQQRELPYAAAWPAAQAFAKYRQRGGLRQSILPDFFIGAHAEVEGMGVLTRDGTRFRTYFPTVPLRSPS